jgi:hypothetical protein
MPELTRSQFDAISQLMRSTPMVDGNSSRYAAKCVLVDGMTQAAAAREALITPAGVAMAVKRIRAIHALCVIAASPD